MSVKKLKTKKRANITLYIPCYNAEKHIRFCLEAVFKQSCPIDEVLAVDDGSTDKTLEMLNQFPVKIIRNQENRGLTLVRNTAIKEAKGQFLASLDADCIPDKDWLKNLMNNFSSKVAGVGGRLLESYASSAMDLWRATHMRQDWGKQNSQSVSFLFGSNNVFKVNILRQIGGYNQKYKNNYEDVDISQRIRKKGYKLVYETRAIARHTKKDNLSSGLDTFWNWNFGYHLDKGYYKDYRAMLKKIGENIGLANRLLRDDFEKDNLQLLYPDFLLSLHLSLKDLFFMYSKDNIFFNMRGKSPYLIYLNLLDLVFFQEFSSRKKRPKTLIPYKDRVFQNFLVFLILTGKIIKDRFSDDNFLENLLSYLLKTFSCDSEVSENLLKRILVLLESEKKWDDLVRKHPNLEKNFFLIFSKNFERWLIDLDKHHPEIFSHIKLSQIK